MQRKNRFGERLNLTVDRETKTRIEALAEAMGISVSAVVRVLVREAAEREGVAA